jgi:hypothetical protein
MRWFVILTLFITACTPLPLDFPEVRNSTAPSEINNNTTTSNTIESNSSTIPIIIPNTTANQLFDWTVTFRCDSCVNWNICDNKEITADERKELERRKNTFLNAFPRGESAFIGYYVRVNQGNENLVSDLPRVGCVPALRFNVSDRAFNMLEILNLSEFKVESVKFQAIIPESQYTPTSAEQLSVCNEVRDCVVVATACCASASCEYKAINKAFHTYWYTVEFNETRDCHDIACIASMCRKGGLSVACEQNLCAVHWSNE